MPVGIYEDVRERVLFTFDDDLLVEARKRSPGTHDLDG